MAGCSLVGVGRWFQDGLADCNALMAKIQVASWSLFIRRVGGKVRSSYCDWCVSFGLFWLLAM